MIELVLPSSEYKETLKQGVQEIINKPSLYDVVAVKAMLEDLATDFDSHFEEHLLKLKNKRLGIDLPEGAIPETVLWLVENGRFIGLYNIRHVLTDLLRVKGGNIGYEIIPSMRGKGIAKIGLKKALEYCRTILGFDKVLLTCEVPNVASYKVMSAIMNEYGGFEDEHSYIDGRTRHRLWISTQKPTD